MNFFLVFQFCFFFFQKIFFLGTFERKNIELLLSISDGQIIILKNIEFKF